MKKNLIFLAVLFSLSACSAYNTPYNNIQPAPVYNAPGTPQAQPLYPVLPMESQINAISPNNAQNVSQIRQKATELNTLISSGKITKTQAAMYLNQYRLGLVGHNPIDDNMYNVYLKAATESQLGHINTEQSKQLIITALKVWQQVWPTMQNRPQNPAFTNFLLETLGLTPLQ